MTNPADHWYMLLGEQTVGPITSTELERMIALGHVSGETLLWQPGFPQWLPAAQTGRMAGVENPAPPPIAQDLQQPWSPPSPPAPQSVALLSDSRGEPSSWPQADGWPSTTARSRTTASGAPSPYRTSLLMVTTGLMLLLAAGVGWFARGLVDGPSARQPALPNPQARLPAAELPPLRAPRDSIASRNPPANVDAPAALARAVPSSPESIADPTVEIPIDRPAAPRIADEPSVPNPPPDSVTSLNTAQSAAASTAPASTAKAPLSVAQVPATPAGDATPADPNLPRASAAAPAVTIFQEIDIERRPKLNILGNELAQHLHYKIVSELRVQPPANNGDRQVTQSVVDTRLLLADELSRADFEKSLQGLKGWQCVYRVRPDGEVRDLAPSAEFAAKARTVEPKGAKGVLVTSIMDADGWREMAEWTFLVPPDMGRGKESWTRRMSHDYGELGSWYGDTRFQRGPTKGSLQQIHFQHQMIYSPPAKPPGGLPFTIREIRFHSDLARGSLEFDLKSQRVRTAQEQFQVRGELTTELLGELASIQVEEQQQVKVTLYEQYRSSPGE